MREPSSEEAEEEIKGKLRAKSAKRCQLTLEYLEQAKNCQRLFSQLTLATLDRVQVHTQLQAVQAECAEKARELKEMEDRYAEGNVRLLFACIVCMYMRMDHERNGVSHTYLHVYEHAHRSEPPI